MAFSIEERKEGEVEKTFSQFGGLGSGALLDQEKAEQGKLIKEAINQGISFVPDMLYEQFVNNYSNAQRLYGRTFINLVSGCDEGYLERNIKIPEFQRELKKRIEGKMARLKEEGLVDNDYGITEKGLEIASLILYQEELDKLVGKGIFGERESKKRAHYGAKSETRTFKKGDRYRDLAIRRSMKKAIRRKRDKICLEDWESFERESHGSCYVIYGLDASGSMKGEKIDLAKKAGVALAYKAIERKDKVGLVVFSAEIKEAVEPTGDFAWLLREITRVRAAKQTDIVKMIRKAAELFPNGNVTKHIILLTDALPTIGEKPREETLKAVSIAKDQGISISLVGINLDKSGLELAKKMVELGEGRLYVVKNLEELDKVVLEDYYNLQS